MGTEPVQGQGGRVEDCVFCRIVAGTVPARVVARDEQLVAFWDINPQAPVHLVVIPTRHVESLASLEPADFAVVGQMAALGARLAREQGLQERGYRLVMNCRRDGGQTVYHVHTHVLGGRAFGWPPG